MPEKINFKLNGNPVSFSADNQRMLLWVLRTDFNLTGTKCGCNEGYCGSCTVLLNNETIRSCQYSLKDIQGGEIMTIEGLAKNGTLHPIQQAFVELDALQCGFCTPGMIMAAYSLLLQNPNPSEREIKINMDDNLCRCGAHTRIVQAIQSAASQLAGGK